MKVKFLVEKKNNGIGTFYKPHLSNFRLFYKLSSYPNKKKTRDRN